MMLPQVLGEPGKFLDTRPRFWWTSRFSLPSKNAGQGTPPDGGDGGYGAARLHGGWGGPLRGGGHGDVGAALGEHPCDVAGNGGFLRKRKGKKGWRKIYT